MTTTILSEADMTDYRALAVAILEQAAKDVEVIPAQRNHRRPAKRRPVPFSRPGPHQAGNVLTFARSGWCETLCELVKIDFDRYRRKIEEQIRSYGTGLDAPA